MVSRRAITLSCDVCGAKAPLTFQSHGQVTAWMNRQGWKFWFLQDWCPACVMRDRQKQLRDAGAPTRSTPRKETPDMSIPPDAEWDLGDDNLGKNTLKALTAAGITPAMADGMSRQERAAIPGMGTARLARLAARLERMRARAEREHAAATDGA